MVRDGNVKTFHDRPIEGGWPYLWIDATYHMVRRSGQIVPVAAIIAVGVKTDGRSEGLEMEIGTSEAEPIWTEVFVQTDPARTDGGEAGHPGRAYSSSVRP